MKNFDVIIIGGGAIGSFTLFNLVQRGARNCLLIEKAPSSGRGATGSWGSLIRAMHMSPLTTKKASFALSYFHRFHNVVGESCGFNQSGSLYFLKADQLNTVEQQLESLKVHHLSFDIVHAKEGKSAFPHFNWFEDDIAIYEPAAGTGCPYKTTESLIRVATSRGARALFNEVVSNFIVDKNRIIAIKTKSGQSFSCDNVVIAAGRWSKSLLEPLGITIDTFDKTIQINRFCRNHFDAKIPLFIDRNLRAFGHFFPDGSFAGGTMMVEDHRKDGFALQRLSISDATHAKMQICKRLNWLKNASLEGGIRACETYTPDGQGMIRNDLGLDNVVVSTGFSCTGFTLAPLAGETIADLILRRHSL